MGLSRRDELERLATFKFDASTRARAANLAAKANEGQLTEEESKEYEVYIELVDVLAWLQAEAKALLAKNDAKPERDGPGASPPS